MNKVVRVGVIGTGFGAHHIEVLRQLPDVEVVGVASAQPARAEAVAERYGVPLATGDYRELLPRVDAVVIATPPALHAPMAIDAASAGVHIFCEKPTAASLAEARSIYAAVEQAGVVGMVNFHQRFMAHWRRAHDLVAEGAIGRLAVADMRVTMNPVEYLASPLWSDSKAGWFADAAQSGGLLASSVGPHLVDMMRWIGGPVSEVAARTITSQTEIPLTGGGTRGDVDADDGFIILGRYENGALLTIRGEPVTYGGNEWDMALHGDEGSLIVAGSELRLGRSGDPSPLVIDQPAAVNPRLAIAGRFIDAARAGGPSPEPDLADGVAAQGLLDAALHAARSNQWVRVEAR
ncbi:MAG TPA: Gfo/Idh/MocA family oxidoreductase [Thermomicrobiales bacterium]|nr:Gfo/Idh/MocA family oxidoreductase [Thermomicrobiales bacterium]